jgi:tetratricopeptide (TPR) repeat protein
VREYALERLMLANEENRARDAHLASMVRLSDAAHEDLVGGRMRERVAQLTHEHGNVAAAMDHALARGKPNAALAIVGSLAIYIKARGIYDLGVQWCRRALAAPVPADAVERGRASLCLGVAAVHLVDDEGSTEVLLIEAIRLATAHGDLWAEAYASGYYSLWLANWKRCEEARQWLAAATHRARQLEDSLLAGLTGLAQGWIHLSEGDSLSAIAVLRSAREASSQELHQRHFIDMYIGLALFSLGAHAAAASEWADALRHAAEVVNIRGIAGSIEGCGYISTKLGRCSEAARFLGAAARIREHTEVPLFNFWLPHHDGALAALRERMGAEAFTLAWTAGRQMREEDAANEAALRLRQLSSMPVAASA